MNPDIGGTVRQIPTTVYFYSGGASRQLRMISGGARPPVSPAQQAKTVGRPSTLEPAGDAGELCERLGLIRRVASYAACRFAGEPYYD
ncbi:hypothetical protein B5P45_11990 [Phyllobacterium zundukense]|uniref:Uncharacterized protein n=1 Tax=Phyllobacterium zundukense TaxID=1867719 RepID=A0A2N9VYL6_9HYPH|nr:hypothetical protein BLM14_25850 [Phyllobacterium zundukense]PIO44584.1 hypothetical protein B5P45_11990 [Phyllobacterium zundukense]